MSRISLTAFLLVICAHLYSQDIIHKNDSTIIEAEVLEVGDADIKYKKFSNPDGPMYTIKKSEVSYIVYQNGEKEIFTQPSSSGSSTASTPKKRYGQKPGKRPAETLSEATMNINVSYIVPSDERYGQEMTLDEYYALPNYSAPLNLGKMGGGFGFTIEESAYRPLNFINRNMRVRTIDWGLYTGGEFGVLLYHMNYTADFFNSSTPLGKAVAEDMNGNYWLFSLKTGPYITWRPSLQKNVRFDLGYTVKAMMRFVNTQALGSAPNNADRRVEIKMEKGFGNRWDFCHDFFFALRLGHFRLAVHYVTDLHDHSDYVEKWYDNDDLTATWYFRSNVNLSHIRFSIGGNINL